jgi:hypothetical protein
MGHPLNPRKFSTYENAQVFTRCSSLRNGNFALGTYLPGAASMEEKSARNE